MLYLLHTHVGERMKQFVEQGGHLIATYVTGYVDENQLNYLGGFPGDGLKDLFGVISEEIDTLYPSDRNRVHFAEMPEGEVRDYAEVLRVACLLYTSIRLVLGSELSQEQKAEVIRCGILALSGEEI